MRVPNRIRAGGRLALLALCAGLSAAPAFSAQNGPLPPVPAAAGEGGAAPRDAEVDLFGPCTREEARRWEAEAERDGTAALRAASCYAVLAEGEEEKSEGLADAERGRKAAGIAVAKLPGSAPAHYLAAYLAGLEADRAPLRGLRLVPVIEREAVRAAELDPAVDRGGPDRMLGELYLRAPGFPISVGDSKKSVAHYRRALAHAPGEPENRLGLAEALLEEEDLAGACGEIRALVEGASPAGPGPRRRAMELFSRHCPIRSR